MNIEVGKKYIRRDGRIAECISKVPTDHLSITYFMSAGSSRYWVQENGRVSNHNEVVLDLIEEFNPEKVVADTYNPWDIQHVKSVSDFRGRVCIRLASRAVDDMMSGNRHITEEMGQQLFDKLTDAFLGMQDTDLLTILGLEEEDTTVPERSAL